MYDSKNRQCDGYKNKKQQKIQAKIHKTLHTKNKYMCNKKHEPLIPGVFQMAKQSLFHNEHASCYSCWKSGDKSWIRKGKDCDHV